MHKLFLIYENLASGRIAHLWISKKTPRDLKVLSERWRVKFKRGAGLIIICKRITQKKEINFLFKWGLNRGHPKLLAEMVTITTCHTPLLG